MRQYVELYGYRVLPQEVSHIEKHKYFMSLEANQDVGMEAAVMDWFRRIRQDFAVWYNRQDITEQMIALNLHLARLSSQGIRFEEADEINRFAAHWRMHHPRIPGSSEEQQDTTPAEAMCSIRFFSDSNLTGAVITKRICLINGLHIRPSVHLYNIMHDRYDVRMMLHNENVDSVSAFCPQFIYEVDGEPFFDVTPVNILEFLEVAALSSGSTLSILVETANDGILRDVCRDLAFLDEDVFCSSFGN